MHLQLLLYSVRLFYLISSLLSHISCVMLHFDQRFMSDFDHVYFSLQLMKHFDQQLKLWYFHKLLMLYSDQQLSVHAVP